MIRWVLVFVVFLVFLLFFFEWMFVDCFLEINALEDRVLGLWMQRALLVE